MRDESPGIPLAEVLRVSNEHVSVGLIEDYALGGALAAIYYTEPVTTYDADIIFLASARQRQNVARAANDASEDRSSAAGRHFAAI
jgi:hypothetical protein